MDAQQVSALQTQIDSISNNTVQNVAQQILNLSVSDESAATLQHLQNMLTLSASGAGTAIFYSGVTPDGTPNKEYAEQVRDVQLTGSGYLWEDTPAGQYLENNLASGMEQVAGGLTPGTYDLFNHLVSAKMADEARGACIACVRGETSGNSYWIQSEYQALLDNAGAFSSSEAVTINSISVEALRAQSLPAIAATQELGVLSQCYTKKQQQTNSSFEINPYFVGAGLLLLGAGALLLGGPGALVGGAAAVVLGTTGARAEPSAPDGNDPAENFLYESELAVWQSQQFVGELTYILGASGQYPELSAEPQFLEITNAFSSLSYLQTELNNPSSAPLERSFVTDDGSFASIGVTLADDGAVRLEVTNESAATPWSSQAFNVVDGGVTLAELGLDDGATVERTLTPGEDPENAASWETTVREVRQQDTRLTSHIELAKPDLISGAQVGAIFGSSLGQLIGGDNVFAQVAAGSALSTVLINVGQSFDLYANGSRVYSDGSSESLSFEEAGGIAFDNIDVEFGAQIRSSGVGFAASFLTAELADEIGLDGRPRVAQKWEPVLGSTTRANNGFGDQLFNYAAQRSSKMRYVGMTRNFGSPEEMINDLQVDDLKTQVFPNEDIRTIALSKDGDKQVKVV